MSSASNVIEDTSSHRNPGHLVDVDGRAATANNCAGADPDYVDAIEARSRSVD